MELEQILAIVILVVIVFLGIILFRINTRVQMKVSFNMDDECAIYNANGLAIFIKYHRKKLANPTLVVVSISNLTMIYKLIDEKEKYLIKIADVMLKGLKDEETLARLAFNKFCILFNNRGKEEIQNFCKNIESNLNSTDFEYNIDIQYRITFGVYEKPSFNDVMEDLNLTESSIKYSKLKDKNFYYFSPDVTAVLAKNATIDAAKKSAYDEKRITSYIQPKVSLKTGRVCGGEILCRWVDEQFKPLYFPDEFIPIFEENGFVKQVDMLMLENACQLLQTLSRRGNDDIVISVNISKANFETENFIQRILDTVNQYNIKYPNIEFEVTETAVMNSPAYVSEIIMQLRQLGFRVAMDDFGKEYSSLGNLSDNPYDTIKLDGIFFRNGLTVDKERYIAKNLITMLSRLNVEIVCEGVEDMDTVDFIGGICNEAVIQGYVFSKPIPLNQFEAFLDTQYDFSFEEIPDLAVTANKGIKKTSKQNSNAESQRVRDLEEKINQLQQAMAYQQQGYNPYGAPNPYQQQGYNPYGAPNPYQQQGYNPYGAPNSYQQQHQPEPEKQETPEEETPKTKKSGVAKVKPISKKVVATPQEPEYNPDDEVEEVEFVDEDGNLVDEEGNLIVEEGDEVLYVDEDGNEIPADELEIVDEEVEEEPAEEAEEEIIEADETEEGEEAVEETTEETSLDNQSEDIEESSEENDESEVEEANEEDSLTEDKGANDSETEEDSEKKEAPKTKKTTKKTKKD